MNRAPVVSPTCEHLIERGDAALGVEPEFCGEPTAFWYPAESYQGGGTMTLCNAHAIPLLPAHFGLHEYAELSL